MDPRETIAEARVPAPGSLRLRRQAGLTDSGGRPSPRSYGRGCHPCYVPGVFRFDKFRFDNQPTQFLQEAVRFTVVVAVVEALVILVAFVLASR